MLNGMVFLHVLIVSLAVTFFYYGLACIFTNHMIEEFARYGFPGFRRLVGSLEVLGAIGLLAGYFVPPVQYLAAGGLALLMFSGCLLRLTIRDSALQILPAFSLMILNLWVFFALLGRR
jgi:hypothetical protein